MTAFLHADVQTISQPLIPIVDFQTKGVELAGHLSSLQNFLGATKYVLTCSTLSCSNFRRHGRKIIRLTEIARATLMRAGVELYPFSSCSASFEPYKAAYFQILVILRQRRKHFDSDVIDRLNRLLLSLSTRMVILKKRESPLNCRSNPRRNYPTLPMAHTKSSVDSRASGSNPPKKYQFSTTSMPPPDAFPAIVEKSVETLERGQSNCRERWSSTASMFPGTDSPPSSHCSSTSSLEREEGNLPSAFIRRPFRRRFGIFCTGKISMYGCRERDGLPVATGLSGHAHA